MAKAVNCALIGKSLRLVGGEYSPYCERMKLTDKDIREFQALWREEFGEEIRRDDAQRRAFELLELYALLARAPWVELDVDATSNGGATNRP
jgi:hypothetical protein